MATNLSDIAGPLRPALSYSPCRIRPADRFVLFLQQSDFPLYRVAVQIAAFEGVALKYIASEKLVLLRGEPLASFQ